MTEEGSLRAALEKWEAARQLYRTAGDKGNEAITLLGMGRINDLLGEKQKALDYYNQALLLRRAVGDRSGVNGEILSEDFARRKKSGSGFERGTIGNVEFSG